MKSSRDRILMLTDGRAGNAAMAEGLAHAVSERIGWPVERMDMNVPAYLRALPARLLQILPTKTVIGHQTSIPEAHLIIGAGGRIAPIVVALGRQGRQTVQILGSNIPASAFDLVIRPMHDRKPGPNTYETLGSVNRVTPEMLSDARDQWAALFSDRPSPRISVLIGGPTKRKAIDPARFNRMIEDLAALQQSTGGSLFVTASRRTTDANMKQLKAQLQGAWIWDGTGENPYAGMLAWADAIIVTDDSVNMASEACTTRSTVAIYPLLQEDGKIARFHQQLYQQHVAEVFSGTLPTHTAPPLNETGRAADAVVAMMGKNS